MSTISGHYHHPGVNYPPLTSQQDLISTRRVSDNFSSSRSYAPEYHAPTAYRIQNLLCEQLREEASRDRMKVSLVCKDLVRYVTDHQSTDALVNGFSSPKDNPFRDKQQCELI